MARDEGVDFISIEGHVTVDQRPYINRVVTGSKQVFDLMKDAESVLDPDGNREFAREASKGKWIDFDYCACKGHLGGRWLPKAEFSPNHYWCKKCESDATFLRRVRAAERKGRPLRDRPGRPRK